MNNNRSIWKEIKFVFRMISDNILPLDNLLKHFSRIAEKLRIEKRIIPRCLQMATFKP
jgi:hypothetical protein